MSARAIWTAVVVTLVVVLAGVSLAAIPSADGTIHACYNKRTKALRVVNVEAGQTCTTKERALSWNQEGPEGPAGSPGPQGSPGPEGPEGPTGPAGSAVAARLRLVSPVTVATEDLTELPLDPDTWTQEAAALNELYVRVSVTTPDDAVNCNSGAAVAINFFLDGSRLNPVQTRTLSFTVGPAATKSMEFGFVTQVVNGTFHEHVLFEPGVDTNHTLTVEGSSTCEGTTFDEVSIDVVSVA